MVYIRRDLEDTVYKYIGSKEIIAIVGPRQCGKTTLINNILSSLKEKGKKISSVSFDDVKTLRLFEDDIDSFTDLHIKGFDFLFIDEVQYSKDSGKKLKYLYDNFNIKIFISGSSAAEISIQSLKYLVGRIFTFVLLPFSFREFLSAKDPALMRLYAKGEYKSEIVSRLNKHLKEYILYGGYPRVVLAGSPEEKITILKNIFNTYLLREIKDILGLSEDHKLTSLLKALSLQIGNLINYSELSGITGFSYGDLKKYANILEKTYISSFVRPFQTNKRIELVKNPKVYFFDLGFRNICIDNFSEERTDKGAIYENFIFCELIKMDEKPKYWRTKSGAEVDFILERSGKPLPLEIKTTLAEDSLTKSFNSFVEKYSPNKGYIVSLEHEGTRRIGNSAIIYLPFVKILQLRKKR